MGNILVVGSMNMDLVVQTVRSPNKGETIMGKTFDMIPGGKGANQASAVGRLGGDVNFIAACGNDFFGETLLSGLRNNGVKTESVSKIGDNTGVASIVVEKDGENRIIIVPGANGKLTPEIVEKHISLIKESKLVLLQLEIPLETVIYTIEIASRNGTAVILDPAPAQVLPEEVYQKVDYILPNEGELKLITDKYNLKTRDERVKKLLELGITNVLLKLGDKGAILYTAADTDGTYFPPIKVKTVDTTAAGDVFAGAFSIGLEQGWEVDKAIKYANIVAGLSVTKLGAQNSIPTQRDVKKYIEEKKLTLDLEG